MLTKIAELMGSGVENFVRFGTHSSGIHGGRIIPGLRSRSVTVDKGGSLAVRGCAYCHLPRNGRSCSVKFRARLKEDELAFNQ